MARNHANDGRVYRAVIVRTYADGRTRTSMFGPYDTPAPAKGLITRAVTDAKRSHGRYRNAAYAHTATGHIESAEVIWMREESSR